MSSSSSIEEKIAQRYFQGKIGNSPMVNKLGITDQDKLDKMEALSVENALANGLSEKAKELSPNGLKQMHKEFFNSIYEWAGNTRHYTTGRGTPFCRPEYIDNLLNKLYDKLNKELASLASNPSQENFVKISAEFIGDLNSIHPFIDGNGRTQRSSLSIIAEKVGYHLDINSIDKNRWYQSAEICHNYADYSGFEKIISDLIDNMALERKNDNYLDNDYSL